jgi:hypothetical protein
MKSLFILWITIRATFNASIWATAVWCLLYSFSSALWWQCFWIFLAIHLIRDLALFKYIRTHTKQDCFSYLRLDSMLVGLSILYAPIIAIVPALAAILILSFLQAWTNQTVHWLHTWLFVTCLVYNLLRAREERRMSRHADSKLAQGHESVGNQIPEPSSGKAANHLVGQAHRQGTASSRDLQRRVDRSAPKAAYRYPRVIDI